MTIEIVGRAEVAGAQRIIGAFFRRPRHGRRAGSSPMIRGIVGSLTEDPDVTTSDEHNFHHRAAEFAEVEG